MTLSFSTVCGLIALFLDCSLGLCLLYYLRLFYACRTEAFYVKRRGDLLLSYAICACVLLLIGMPLFLFAEWQWALSPTLHSVPYTILSIIAGMIWMPCVQALFVLLQCRYWLMFYEIQFQYSCSTIKWQQCITTNVQALRKEAWFLKYRGKYGNARYCLRCAVLMIAVVSILLVLDHIRYVFALWPDVRRLFWPFQAIQILVVYCLFTVTWKKTPLFEDHIRLYYEMKILIRFLFVFLLIYIVAVALLYVLNRTTPIHDFHVSSAVIHWLGACTIFGLPVVSMRLALRELQRASRNGVSFQREPLRQVLCDPNALNLFAQNLLLEFSIESLLALIELHQFNTNALELLQLEITPSSPSLAQSSIRSLTSVSAGPSEIEFAENVPRSDIVYGSNESFDDNVKQFKQQAYQLYSKYIVDGAEFETNIDFATKDGLNQLMRDYEDWMADSREFDPKSLVSKFRDLSANSFGTSLYSV